MAPFTKYTVELIKGKYRGKRAYRVRLRFANGRIFMHSEYYINQSHAKEMALGIKRSMFPFLCKYEEIG